MPEDLFRQLTDPSAKDYSGLRGYAKDITNQQKKQYMNGRLGMIIDGFVDNVVYISVYLGGLFYLLPSYGWPIFIIGAISGLGHSLRSLIYVSYKDDCLYFYGDKSDHYRPTMDELRENNHEVMIFR